MEWRSNQKNVGSKQAEKAQDKIKIQLGLSNLPIKWKTHIDNW